MCGGPSRRRWRAMAAMANHHDIAAGWADATDQEKNVLSRNDDNPARRLARGVRAMFQSSISLFYWT